MLACAHLLYSGRKGIDKSKDMVKGLNKIRGAGLTKAQIRSKILSVLKTQKEEDRNRKSRVIQGKLLRNKVFKKAKIVMFYVAFGGEVNTEEMIREAKKIGKLICVPVCRKDRETMQPAILEDHSKLRKGPYGVLEPVSEIFIKPEDLDLIIVPGLAFDFQILPFIPTTAYDVSVKQVIFS